jgi:hypothetical protein
VSPGLEVFHSLADALRAGWQVCDRFTDGYIVRRRSAAGMVMALVVLRDNATLAEHPDAQYIGSA